jgi:hypothetical protein
MRNVLVYMLVGKSEGYSSSGTKSRWEDNIKMDSKEIGREDVDWIHVSQDKVQ